MLNIFASNAFLHRKTYYFARFSVFLATQKTRLNILHLQKKPIGLGDGEVENVSKNLNLNLLLKIIGKIFSFT